MTQTTTFPHGGTVARGFERVQDAFLEAQAKDRGGAQLCVYRRGERVVDLWAGRDPLGDRPYGEDTIAVLMSCTKGVVACAVHMLADRGLVDYDKPLAAYWPAFGQAGKEDITVRQLLRHTAGLMGYDAETQMGMTELFDQQRPLRELELMRPLWAPGTAVMYHFVTFGTMMAELVRRVDGRSVGQFVAEEIAGPLGVDLWIGLPAAQEARRAPHFNEGPQIGVDGWRALFAAAGCDLDDRLIRAFIATAQATDPAIAQLATSRAFRAAEFPAGNGIANAKALGQDLRGHDRRSGQRAAGERGDHEQGARAADRGPRPARRTRQARPRPALWPRLGAARPGETDAGPRLVRPRRRGRPPRLRPSGKRPRGRLRLQHHAQQHPHRARRSLGGMDGRAARGAGNLAATAAFLA